MNPFANEPFHICSVIHEHDTIMADTSLLCLQGEYADIVFEHIETALLLSGKPLFIPGDVLLEIDRLKSADDDDRHAAGQAGERRLLHFIRQNLAVLSEHVYSTTHADSAFMAIRDQDPGRKYLLITRDFNLGADVWIASRQKSVAGKLTALVVDLRDGNCCFREAEEEAARRLTALVKTVTPSHRAGPYGKPAAITPARPAPQRIGPYGRPAPVQSSVSAPAKTAETGVPAMAEDYVWETGPVSPGARLTTGRGAEIVLGEQIGNGSESLIFRACTADGMSCAAKVYRQASALKERKVTYLSEISVQGAALPQDILKDGSGNFCGYTMPLFEDCCTLEALLSPLGRAFSGLTTVDRSVFADIGLRIAKTLAALADANVRMVDLNPENFIVRLCKASRDDTPGVLVRDVQLIDVDSAQIIITADKHYLPAGGFSPEYVSPRMAEEGYAPGQFVSSEDYAFMTALLLGRVAMAGTPLLCARFADSADDEELTIADRIVLAKETFPFGTRLRKRAAAPIDGAKALWSHLSPSLKSTIARSMTAAPEARPLLPQYVREFEYYKQSCRDLKVLNQDPEYLALAPKKNRPYIIECERCGQRADVANSRVMSREGANGGKEWLCEKCTMELSAKPVALCSCGQIAMHEGHRWAGKTFGQCRDCFNKFQSLPPGTAAGSSAGQRPAFPQTLCSVCGKAFHSAAGETECPDCFGVGILRKVAGQL